MSIVPLLSSQRGSDPVNAWELGVLSDGGSFVAPSNTDALYDRLVSLGLVASASLVNSCNGGKADALYNFIPSPVQSLDRFVVTRASTKLRIGSDGLYGSVANNVPAFEFNTDGTYRGLLVEPGATNLALHSQDFTDAGWVATGATVSANATTAPDGTLTADKLAEDNSVGGHGLDRTISVAAATHTWSFFAKASERNFARIIYTTGMATPANYIVDLTTGVATNIGGTTAFVSINTQSYPNGWWRISLANTPNGGNRVFTIRVAQNNVDTGYTGVTGNGIFIWQAQLETGSVATSPIVTTAGTASRVIDLQKMTGIGGLFGGSSMLFASWRNQNTSATRVFGTLWENATNYIQLSLDTSNRLVGEVVAGGVSQASFTSSALVTGTQYGAVLSFDTDSVFMCLNGAQVGATDTTATIPTVTKGNLGHGLADDSSANCHFKAWGILDTPTTVETANSLTTQLASL
jgi:hypothetical protein